jgi:transcriptional regulator with XRE-family HTH domain
VKLKEEAFYRRLGEQVRDQRRRRGLTQEALSALWNLDRTTVVNIEKGRQRISVYQLVALANHLGCPPQEFLPELSEPAILSEGLRDKAGDDRAISFVSEVAAATRRPT